MTGGRSRIPRRVQSAEAGRTTSRDSARSPSSSGAAAKDAEKKGAAVMTKRTSTSSTGLRTVRSSDTIRRKSPIGRIVKEEAKVERNEKMTMKNFEVPETKADSILVTKAESRDKLQIKSRGKDASSKEVNTKTTTPTKKLLSKKTKKVKPDPEPKKTGGGFAMPAEKRERVEKSGGTPAPKKFKGQKAKGDANQKSLEGIPKSGPGEKEEDSAVKKIEVVPTPASPLPSAPPIDEVLAEAEIIEKKSCTDIGNKVAKLQESLKKTSAMKKSSKLELIELLLQSLEDEEAESAEDAATEDEDENTAPAKQEEGDVDIQTEDVGGDDENVLESNEEEEIDEIEPDGENELEKQEEVEEDEIEGDEPTDEVEVQEELLDMMDETNSVEPVEEEDGLVKEAEEVETMEEDTDEAEEAEEEEEDEVEIAQNDEDKEDEEGMEEGEEVEEDEFDEEEEGVGEGEQSSSEEEHVSGEDGEVDSHDGDFSKGITNTVSEEIVPEKGNDVLDRYEDEEDVLTGKKEEQGEAENTIEQGDKPMNQTEDSSRGAFDASAISDRNVNESELTEGATKDSEEEKTGGGQSGTRSETTQAGDENQESFDNKPEEARGNEAEVSQKTFDQEKSAGPPPEDKDQNDKEEGETESLSKTTISAEEGKDKETTDVVTKPKTILASDELDGDTAGAKDESTSEEEIKETEQVPQQEHEDGEPLDKKATEESIEATQLGKKDHEVCSVEKLIDLPTAEKVLKVDEVPQDVLVVGHAAVDLPLEPSEGYYSRADTIRSDEDSKAKEILEDTLELGVEAALLNMQIQEEAESTIDGNYSSPGETALNRVEEEKEAPNQNKNQEVHRMQEAASLFRIEEAADETIESPVGQDKAFPGPEAPELQKKTDESAADDQHKDTLNKILELIQTMTASTIQKVGVAELNRRAAAAVQQQQSISTSPLDKYMSCPELASSSPEQQQKLSSLLLPPTPSLSAQREALDMSASATEATEDLKEKHQARKEEEERREMEEALRSIAEMKAAMAKMMDMMKEKKKSVDESEEMVDEVNKEAEKEAEKCTLVEEILISPSKALLLKSEGAKAPEVSKDEEEEGVSEDHLLPVREQRKAFEAARSMFEEAAKIGGGQVSRRQHHTTAKQQQQQQTSVPSAESLPKVEEEEEEEVLEKDHGDNVEGKGKIIDDEKEEDVEGEYEQKVAKADGKMESIKVPSEETNIYVEGGVTSDADGENILSTEEDKGITKDYNSVDGQPDEQEKNFQHSANGEELEELEARSDASNLRQEGKNGDEVLETNQNTEKESEAEKYESGPETEEVSSEIDVNAATPEAVPRLDEALSGKAEPVGADVEEEKPREDDSNIAIPEIVCSLCKDPPTSEPEEKDKENEGTECPPPPVPNSPQPPTETPSTQERGTMTTRETETQTENEFDLPSQQQQQSSSFREEGTSPLHFEFVENMGLDEFVATPSAKGSVLEKVENFETKILEQTATATASHLNLQRSSNGGSNNNVHTLQSFAADAVSPVPCDGDKPEETYEDEGGEVEEGVGNEVEEGESNEWTVLKGQENVRQTTATLQGTEPESKGDEQETTDLEENTDEEDQEKDDLMPDLKVEVDPTAPSQATASGRRSSSKLLKFSVSLDDLSCDVLTISFADDCVNISSSPRLLAQSAIDVASSADGTGATLSLRALPTSTQEKEKQEDFPQEVASGEEVPRDVEQEEEAEAVSSQDEGNSAVVFFEDNASVDTVVHTTIVEEEEEKQRDSCTPEKEEEEEEEEEEELPADIIEEANDEEEDGAPSPFAVARSSGSHDNIVEDFVCDRSTCSQSTTTTSSVSLGGEMDQRLIEVDFDALSEEEEEEQKSPSNETLHSVEVENEEVYNEDNDRRLKRRVITASAGKTGREKRREAEEREADRRRRRRSNRRTTAMGANKRMKRIRFAQSNQVRKKIVREVEVEEEDLADGIDTRCCCFIF